MSVKRRGASAREHSEDRVENVSGTDVRTFQKLTPTDDVDDLLMDAGYRKALDFIYEEGNEDIRNIAVTGPYGSGKSSVLETYKKQSEQTFYHVYLADFPDSEKKGADCTDGNKKIVASDSGEKNGRLIKMEVKKKREEENPENTIEGKMLNQLIQQIPKSKIPYTGFKVKRDCRKSLPVLISLSIAVVVAGIVFLASSESWLSWVCTWESWARKNGYYAVQDLFKFTLEPWFRVIVVVIVSVVILLWLIWIVSLFANKAVLKRVSLNGNEIEILSEERSLCFDKYLNEILYLFDRLERVTVVFEDIDRFDDAEIFVRLREINLLINYRDENRATDPIRFMYLMKDDIFLTKDKTKFFDYIVPIVPVVDASNSHDVLREYLRTAGYGEKDIDDDFLYGISAYIDDIRLAKNIVNEFSVFDALLRKTPEQNPRYESRKMLAMVTYKNFFPRDYANLQLKRGFVHGMLNSIEEKKMGKEDLRRIDGAEYGKMVDSVFCSLRVVDPAAYNGIDRNDHYFGLLNHLVLEGYIDASYSLYMTYSREGGLGMHDRDFVRSVQNREKVEEDHPLFDADSVMAYMTPDMLARPEALNFDLLDRMVTRGDNERLAAVAGQLTDTGVSEP